MGPKLDKKFGVVLRGSSAHSILWIFRSLSTKGSQKSARGWREGDLVDVGHVFGPRMRPESVDFFELCRMRSSKSTSVLEGTAWSKSKKNVGRAAPFEARRQVYNQKLVYRMMVIVNGGTLLWISRVFSTTSNVYGSHKAVGWSCMCLEAKLDKKWEGAKNRCSSHVVPVDIHTLIHSPQSSC